MRRLELALALAAVFAWAGWAGWRFVPPVAAPAPVELDACRPARVVIDFPVRGGTHFRRLTVPCIWI